MGTSNESKLEALFERARKLDAANGGRKQHIVPASYLRRWSEEERVRVTDLSVSPRRTYCARPEKVGLETDFYRLEGDGVEPDEVPPLVMEVMLSDVEGKAKLGIDELLADGHPSAENGAALASFIALQATRGRAFRATLRAAAEAFARRHVEGFDAAAVRRRLTENGVEPTEDAVADALAAVEKIASGQWRMSPQDAALAALSAHVADELVRYLLLGRHWLVYDTPPLLVTCDEPVVALGGPRGERGERAGFQSAPVILFPLTPSKLLVLLRNDLEPETRLVLDRLEVAEINRELVASSVRWVFERPARRVGVGMPVPGPLPPLGEERFEGTSDGRPAVLVRQHRPTRWVAAPDTPWPVERWWRRWS